MLEFMCADALRLGRFWSELLEIPLDEGANQQYAQFTPPGPQPKWLFIQSEHRAGADRFVIALSSYDLTGDAARAVSLGATHATRHHQDGFEWVDLEDPEGNHFTFNAPPPE